MTIERESLDAGMIDFADVADMSVPRIGPTPPGTLLREEWLEPLGITPYRLARDIGVPPNRVTAILSGQRGITADTALRLARYFGTDAQSWMNLQARFDLALEQLAHGDEIDKTVHPRAA
jgi:addiction module HigA family antidote